MHNDSRLRDEDRKLKILNNRGLHARAAAKFAGIAGTFTSKIEVERGGQIVSGMSIMGLMMLAAGSGCSISVRATGPDAVEALDALEALVARRFDEKD